MVQLAEVPFWIDEECPALDVAMPRAYRKPPAPHFLRRKHPLNPLIARAQAARRTGNSPEFGKSYGELSTEFQPAIDWIRSCWDYLLSTQGCRFLVRTDAEKLCARGDYRVFTERDFEKLIYRVFRRCLEDYLDGGAAEPFLHRMQNRFWPSVLEAYRALENPADPTQRKLTGWSYLRCVPYQFLNDHHQDRVYRAVRRLPEPLRKTIELYHLSFYTEEAAVTRLSITPLAFQRRRAQALRQIKEEDFLSFVLLSQVERY